MKSGVRLLVALCLSLTSLAAAEWTVSGRVIDENEVAVREAEVVLRGTVEFHLRAVTDPTGRFTLRVPAGDYRVTVEREGFFPLKNVALQIHDNVSDLQFTLNHAKEILQSVDVTASPTPIDIDKTEAERRLSGIQILDVPYPSTHSLRNALGIMPGVIIDPQGTLHFDGGKESQTTYLLNGFNLSDPLTGGLNSHLSVEAVQSLDYLSGRYSPELGKGSAGALEIKTENGDNEFRYSATNFIPGIDTRKGLNLGSWTPRTNLSGPIVRDRAWFSDSLDGNYSLLIVPDLPSGQDRSTSWLAANIFHTQVNLTPSNILFADFLANYGRATDNGLSALDPPSTTTDIRNRTWFTSVKDQIYIGRGTLLELGYGELDTFLRQIPQGTSDYIIAPQGREGNYFINATETARRGQFIGNLYLPAFHWAGSHQLKTGVDVDRLDYSQDFHRTGYELFGETNNLLRSATFAGSGRFSKPSLEVSSYLLDHWQVRRNLIFEIGVRQDWDELVRRASGSPRLSFSYSPFGNTRIAGGYAVVYDESTLGLFTRPLDQYSLSNVYAENGTLLRSNSLTVFTNAGNLAAARVQAWTLGVDRLFPHSIRMNVGLLRRRGGDQFAYEGTLSQPEAAPPAFADTYHADFIEQIFTLTNARHDQYDSAQVIVHQSLAGRYEWMASYTRSRAHSNDVLEQTIDQPLLVQSFNNTGPLPWDAPNRFLSWGYLPTFRKNWAVAYLLEMRSGFPFSIQHDTGDIIGAPDSQRFPGYFNLNLHLEWRFHLGKYRFALRGGANNLTNHRNPTTVNGTVEAPQYRTFYGSDARHFVLRLRWLGQG